MSDTDREKVQETAQDERWARIAAENSEPANRTGLARVFCEQGAKSPMTGKETLHDRHALTPKVFAVQLRAFT
jgi:hypothetical protein